MIGTGSGYLLMIEPVGAPSEPIVDDVTRAAMAALAAAKAASRTRGWHSCTGRGCRASSDSTIWKIAGVETNSLVVHYVARHRDEVPQVEIDKLMTLGLAPVEPTIEAIDGRGTL